MAYPSPDQLQCRWHEQSFQNRANRVVAVGQSTFAETALISTPPQSLIGRSDLLAVDQFFVSTKPDANLYPQLANWNSRGGLVEHCDFAGAIAFELASAVNESTGSRLRPNDHRAALQLHDLGRTVLHSFMETDIMTDHLWGMIGLRQDLHDLTHSAHLYWDEVETPVANLTVAQRISIVADTAGKRSSVNINRLRLAEEIIPSVQAGKKKYLSKPNPTIYEQMLIERLPQYSKREDEAIAYTLSWFAGLGINLDVIIQAIPLERLS